MDTDNLNYRPTRATNKLRDILEEFSMDDAWRYQHASIRRYTWRRRNPRQQSRIDYIFMSTILINNEEFKTKIESGILSDHNLVKLEVSFSAEKCGPGNWQFNNNLLEDFGFINSVRTEIQVAADSRGVYSEEISRGLKVEMLLANIRVIAMKRSREIARDLRRTENELHKKVNDLEPLIATSTDEHILREFNLAKEDLDEIKMKRGKLAIIRSQARWIEDGEKPSKYFLRLAKQRIAEKRITALQNADGSVVHGNRAILEECVEHYKKLYTSDRITCNDQFAAFALGRNDPRLTEEEKLSCEGPISVEECRYALAKMARNKTAGISGFSAEFYSFFWTDIGTLIVDYVNDARQAGELFITHRRGLLTLIPKKDAKCCLPIRGRFVY